LVSACIASLGASSACSHSTMVPEMRFEMTVVNKNIGHLEIETAWTVLMVTLVSPRNKPCMGVLHLD